MMGWTLRFASHLGYRSPDAPLFRESAGSPDPIAQIRYAAELGFAGVQDAWFVSRTSDEQRAIGSALERHGLEAGCVVYTSRDKIRQPLWARSDRASRDLMRTELARAIEATKRINARWLAILSGSDPHVPTGLQLAALIENLRWAADMAAAAGRVLLLESMSSKSLSNMLLHHIDEAYAVVKGVGNPALKLIFDTSHIQIMDGDLFANLAGVCDEVALIQLADNPGRLQPGTGEINFENLLRLVKQRGYTGLVELEHGWSEQIRAVEQRGIEWLRKVDAQL